MSYLDGLITKKKNEKKIKKKKQSILKAPRSERLSEWID